MFTSTEFCCQYDRFYRRIVAAPVKSDKHTRCLCPSEADVSLTGLEFLAPTLALWTISFLSPSCIPLSPATACSRKRHLLVRRGTAGRKERKRHGARRYLIGGADVHVLAEGVAFRQRGGAVLHQVEGFEGPEWRQQLLHLQNDSEGRRHEDNDRHKDVDNKVEEHNRGTVLLYRLQELITQ